MPHGRSTRTDQPTEESAGDGAGSPSDAGTDRMTLRDAQVLRGYLRLMAMSERGLASAAGVGHATVNHLLSGRRTTCTAETARAIESVLACPDGLFFAPLHPRRRAGAPAPRP